MNYTEIMSGRRGVFYSALLRVIMLLPSLLYYLLIMLRNSLYNFGLLPVCRVSVPVICVGNITAGGTGKTPMVVWLCRYLHEKDQRVAILSRGYKSSDINGLNDEMKLLSDALPGIQFYIGSDRSKSARQAQTDGATILVMDDGYQHRRLHRDLNILMIDGLCPFGYGRMLPSGLLREPLSQISRAGAAVISRADLTEAGDLEQIKRKVLSYSEMPVIMGCHRPSGLYSTDGVLVDLTELSGAKVTAFCSIGNPVGFVATLEKLGAEVCGRYFFDDHSEYDSERVAILSQILADVPDHWLVTTQKDWVKLRELPDIAGLDRLFWLKVEMDFIEGEAEIKNLVDNIVNLN